MYWNIAKVFIGLFFLSVVRSSGPSDAKFQTFMRNHNCRPGKTKILSDGFASYTLTNYTCTGTLPSVFYWADCNENCKNPVSGKTLSPTQYKTEALTCPETFLSRGGEKETYSINTACRCVGVVKQGTEGKKSRKRGSKKSRGGKSKRKRKNGKKSSRKSKGQTAAV